MLLGPLCPAYCRQTGSYPRLHLLVNNLWESGQAHNHLYLGTGTHRFWLRLFNQIQTRLYWVYWATQGRPAESPCVGSRYGIHQNGRAQNRTRDPLRDRQLQKIYLVGPSNFVLRRGTRFGLNPRVRQIHWAHLQISFSPSLHLLAGTGVWGRER